LSTGAPPQSPLGELTALPRPPSWILRGLLLRGRGKNERRREGEEGREGEEKGKGKGSVTVQRVQVVFGRRTNSFIFR